MEYQDVYLVVINVSRGDEAYAGIYTKKELMGVLGIDDPEYIFYMPFCHGQTQEPITEADLDTDDETECYDWDGGYVSFKRLVTGEQASELKTVVIESALNTDPENENRIKALTVIIDHLIRAESL